MEKKVFGFITTLIMLCSFVGVMPVMKSNEVSANCSASKIVSVAQGEVGTTSGYHKRNKYTIWNGKIDKYEDSGYGYPWCATFVSWCAKEAGCLDVIAKSASSSYQWSNTSGSKHDAKSGYKPKSGDLIFYDYGTSHSLSSLDHVGIVESFDGSIVHTIEGNYNNSVSRVNRPYSSNDIYGYVSPNYISDVPPEPDPTSKWYDVLTPVNLGDCFYAYIINTQFWKSLCNDVNNVSMRKEVGILKETWKFERQADKSYKIINCYDHKVLDVSGAGSINGTNVGVCDSNDSNAQRWFIYGSSGQYYLRAKCSDLVLDIQDGIDAEGQNVQMWEKNDSVAQKFQIWKREDYEEPFNLGDEFDALILSKKYWKPIMMENSISEGSRVVLGTENQTNMTRLVWHFLRNSDDGSYHIKSYYNWGLSMDVIDSKDVNETKIGVYQTHDGANQKWFFYRSKDAYIIRPGCSANKVLDLNGNNSSDGTPIQIFERNNTDAQVFDVYQFKPAGKSEIKATAGTESTNTKFSWTKATNATEYTVKVWKNKVSEGDVFKEFSTKDTSWNVILPEGTYQAYVDSYNTYSHSQSNVITIKVGSCQHNFSDWSITKAATCTEDGSETRKCSICGKSETAVITKTSHKYSDTVVKPTCIEKGYTLHKCSVCKNEYKDTYVDAKGHKYNSKIVSSTFTEKGYTFHTCSECGDSYKDNYTPVKIKGDINNDSSVGISDAVYLQKYLVKSKDISIEDISSDQFFAADMNSDGKINVFDMIILRRMILKG